MCLIGYSFGMSDGFPARAYGDRFGLETNMPAIEEMSSAYLTRRDVEITHARPTTDDRPSGGSLGGSACIE
jgi:hypothetical protein